MQLADLRPLSIGELLDRSFTLYRRYFLLFLGISGVPHIVVLALNLGRIFYNPTLAIPRLPGHGTAPAPTGFDDLAFWSILSLVIVVVSVVVAVLCQGATVVAVSEIYVGRTITIAESFERATRAFFRLLGVVVITTVVVFVGFIFLFVPGAYLFCRLLVAVPVTMMEGLPPRQSLERSFSLTKDQAGRSFLILLLYFFLATVGSGLLYMPFLLLIMLSKHSPEITVIWLALGTVGQIISTVLVSPILYISSSLFYFDLRVRKEGFDLELMMVSDTAPSVTTPGLIQQPNLFS